MQEIYYVFILVVTIHVVLETHECIILMFGCSTGKVKGYKSTATIV